MNFLIWTGASAAMFYLGDPGPLGWGALLGLFLAIVRKVRRKSRLDSLAGRYVSLYGESPLALDLGATGMGGAVGAATGHYVAGGLIGAVIDVGRQVNAERKMSSEQKALHREIAYLTVQSPVRSFLVLVMWLAMSWGALGAVHIVST
jgi:hypothetical protein